MAVLHDTPADGTFSAAGALHWDAAHTVEDNTFVAAKLSATDDTILFGRATAGAGAGEEIIIGTNLSLTGTTLNAASGSSTWDTIAAAAGDGSTLNGDWNMVYQVAKVTNSENSFSFIESAAATNGTSSSGIPNQNLIRIGTIAASTMSPLSVYSRGSHVFSISPDTAQILASGSGSAASPVYSFPSDKLAGMCFLAGRLKFSIAGTILMEVRTDLASHTMLVPAGSAAQPAITTGTSTAGVFFVTTTTVGIGVNAIENSRFEAGLFQASKGTADAVAYAINARKARGTVASPTVITTGDDLLTESGWAYVGATGYVEATRITHDSTGTIANTTSGTGGIIRFAAAVVGTVGPVEIAQVNGTEQHLLHVGTVPSITAGGGAGPSPTIAGTDEAFTVTVGGGGIANSVEVTFAKAFTVPPRCTANHQGAVLILRCVSLVNKVTIDAATPFTTSGLIDVICRSGTT